jgi:hypothetical protein
MDVRFCVAASAYVIQALASLVGSRIFRPACWPVQDRSLSIPLAEPEFVFNKSKSMVLAQKGPVFSISAGAERITVL